jgi:hypothetical protein
MSRQNSYNGGARTAWYLDTAWEIPFRHTLQYRRAHYSIYW